MEIGQLGQRLVHLYLYVTLRVCECNLHHAWTIISANGRKEQWLLSVIDALHPLSDKLDITRVVCTTKVVTQFLSSALPNIISLRFAKKATKQSTLQLSSCRPTDFSSPGSSHVLSCWALNYKYDKEIKASFRSRWTQQHKVKLGCCPSKSIRH